MNGKDLMQALNDIDERYIEEALPWSAAVKKERHPVWALAAGLALCLGLGAGAALLFGGPLLTSGDPGPEVTTLENAATGEARAAEQEAPEVPIPDLEFAVNDTGIGRATGGVYAAGEGTQRELTLDELSSLREQPGLSWMGGYYLTGTALFDENGGTLQVMVAGYDPSIVDESLETFPVTESPAFTLVLGKEGESGLPNAIEDQLFFLEEPNNTVEGVGVRAAQFPYQGGYIDPVSGETIQVDSTLYCTGYTLDGANVGLMAVGGDTLTEEEAQHLAEVAAGYGVYHGLSLEGISAEPKGKDTPNVNYGDSYHLTVLAPLDIPQEESSASSQSESAVPSEIEENESTEGGLNYLDVSFNTSEYIPYMEEQTQLYQHYAEAEQRGETWSVSRGLEEDELNFLLDQDFLPNQEDFAILEGGATLDWMEEPLWVELSGSPTQETRSTGISAFTLYLAKGDIPVSRAKYLSTLFPEPNNTLEGVDIYAFRWEEETNFSQFSTPAEGQPYIPPVYDHDDSVLFALAFQKEDIGVAMTVRCDKWGFASEEEAQDFALSLAENIITQEVIPMENDMQVLSLPEN